MLQDGNLSCNRASENYLRIYSFLILLTARFLIACFTVTPVLTPAQ